MWNVEWSYVELLWKGAAEHNSDIKSDILKFDTVFLHSNWSRLSSNSQTYWVVGQKHKKFGRHFPRPTSTKILAVCTRRCPQPPRDDAICSENSKIVLYHGNSPNTRNADAYGFHSWLWLLYLTNKEASTALCSVVKHAGSGRARKKCRGKHETQSSVFPHFLSALPLPKCFTTEQSSVEASLFVLW